MVVLKGLRTLVLERHTIDTERRKWTVAIVGNLPGLRRSSLKSSSLRGSTPLKNKAWLRGSRKGALFALTSTASRKSVAIYV